MAPMRAMWTMAMMAATALAGCSGSGPGPVSQEDAEETGAPSALTVVNYTLGAPPTAPYVKDYADILMPQEWENYPIAPDPTCCAYWRMDVGDLLAAGQVAQVRITLNWTNDPQNHADLDIAPCIPYNCGFVEGEDQSAEMGAHSEVAVFTTRGAEGDETSRLGVRYHNAALSTGLAYTLRVEVVPLADAIPAYRPYEFTLPENATLRFELMAPLGAPLGLDAAAATAIVFFADDRPRAYGSVSGDDGNAVRLGLPPGRHVVVVQSAASGALRMRAEAPAADVPATLRLLPTTYDRVEVATLSDPSQEAEGTYSHATPPGTIDVIPWFEFADGAVSAQSDLGLGVADGGFLGNVSSSSGTLYEIRIREDSADLGAVGVGHACLSCQESYAFDPAAIFDDDGTYDYTYRADRTSGTVVLYVYRYGT